MAMAKCRECGREVSSQAKTCPNCGVKRPAAGISKLSIGVLVIFGLGVLGAGMSPLRLKQLLIDGTQRDEARL
jgi:hypothetical protein